MRDVQCMGRRRRASPSAALLSPSRFVRPSVRPIDIAFSVKQKRVHPRMYVPGRAAAAGMSGRLSAVLIMIYGRGPETMAGAVIHNPLPFGMTSFLRIKSHLTPSLAALSSLRGTQLAR